MLRVLIVDDSKAVHAFIQGCLSKHPHTLLQAYDGEEALKVLSAPGREFDLILLDWEMPKLKGPETFAAIRAKKIQTPVIMMTSRNAVEDIKKMIDAGVAEYMMKPFTKDILIEKLEIVLGELVRDAS